MQGPLRLRARAGSGAGPFDEAPVRNVLCKASTDRSSLRVTSPLYRSTNVGSLRPWSGSAFLHKSLCPSTLAQDPGRNMDRSLQPLNKSSNAGSFEALSGFQRRFFLTRFLCAMSCAQRTWTGPCGSQVPLYRSSNAGSLEALGGFRGRYL